MYVLCAVSACRCEDCVSEDCVYRVQSVYTDYRVCVYAGVFVYIKEYIEVDCLQGLSQYVPLF